MDKRIGACEAKTKLPELLCRVEAGEHFVITNRGRPIAELRPVRVLRGPPHAIRSRTCAPCRRFAEFLRDWCAS
ncbi:MAG TPA: type II toxin-antitoxin system prevent-host-death family antitoxin [Casimicrobiaceae bacterium]|nr:type II toxin-antitoxin system prevent-host-death family antitoxin [Casimicrobiaceae bacterium]